MTSEVAEGTVASDLKSPGREGSSTRLEGSAAVVGPGHIDAAAMEEFAYRPVTPLAPMALFLGICSVAGFLGLPALAIGIVGMLCGLLALWQIRRSEGALGGGLVAKAGLALSALLTVGAVGFHAYTYVTEVPEGHERVTFAWLSKQPMAFEDSNLMLPKEVVDLNEKPVFIKGYMYPTRLRDGLSEFLLVKDTGDCCFGRQPKLTDVIVVHMKDGQTARYKEQQLVSVGGVFKISGLHQSGDVQAIFSMDSDHFR